MVKKLMLILSVLCAFFVMPAIAQLTQQPAKDQTALLQSDDPVLAANKNLVYDMYREVLEAGQVSRISHYFVEDYIQHNPNVVTGRTALKEFIAGSRPVRAADETIKLPLISIIAEADLVMINFIRPEKDENGDEYYTTWFDVFRIRDGKISEHWDPALKSIDALKFDPNTKRL